MGVGPISSSPNYSEPQVGGHELLLRLVQPPVEANRRLLCLSLHGPDHVERDLERAHRRPPSVALELGNRGMRRPPVAQGEEDASTPHPERLLLRRTPLSSGMLRATATLDPLEQPHREMVFGVHAHVLPSAHFRVSPNPQVNDSTKLRYRRQPNVVGQQP